MSRYQKGITNLDFNEARDRKWQWHQLGHMQVCTSLQTDNHTSTPPLSFLQAGCPYCRPTNSVKALKGYSQRVHLKSAATVLLRIFIALISTGQKAVKRLCCVCVIRIYALIAVCSASGSRLRYVMYSSVLWMTSCFYLMAKKRE